MFLLIGSFIAGIITVFAPCVLPLLPIIIGGSISGKVSDKKRPVIIAASLAVSLIIFTLLLKATTLLINVPPSIFTVISGVILIVLGVLLFFPDVYEKFIIRFNLQLKSQALLGKSSGKSQLVGAIITGAALGPVFSSCSPVYAYILATVLPTNFAEAMLYMTSYVLGLSLMLLLIGYLGQKFLHRIKFLTNPKGWFMRTIAVIFVLVGLLIVTGSNTSLQTWVANHTPFDFDGLSSKLLPNQHDTTSGVFNVKSYKAPEFKGLDNWINSKPKTLSDEKGKVVLIDFWTYSCINCIREEPYLENWYKTYHSYGLDIIGMHAPEFSFERKASNVRDAVKAAGLTYPVALDNNLETWNAYGNQSWPGQYLIDKQGNVRRIKNGEGQYKQMEEAIRSLLKADGGSVPDKSAPAMDGEVPVSSSQTPETYLGNARADQFVGSPNLTTGTHDFAPAKLSSVSDWTLGGSWKIGDQSITAGERATISIRFAAKDLYLVTGNDVSNKTMSVRLNGKAISGSDSGSDVKNSQVKLGSARLYRLVNFSKFQSDNTLTLKVPAGVDLNTFTFGS